MLISHEETFGPVAAVAPFDTEEEAIALANDSDLRARRLLPHARLRAAAAGRREARVRDRRRQLGPRSVAANVPFGGVKESGYGREGGDFGIDEYVDVKYVLVAGVD